MLQEGVKEEAAREESCKGKKPLVKKPLHEPDLVSESFLLPLARDCGDQRPGHKTLTKITMLRT